VILRNSLALAIAGPLALAAMLVTLPAVPATAQTGMEEVQDEGSAYRAWHQASQANDNTKAMEAAKAYLAKYPTGQYAQFLTNWLPTAKMAALDAALREKRTADAIAVGREILAGDAENLNVLSPLAFGIRREMAAGNHEHAADGVEFAKKAIALIEAGRTPANVPTFNKNATLAGLINILALNAQKTASPEEAIKLYEQSSAIVPQGPLVAPNLLAIYNLRLASYGEAAKALKAFPDADKAAPEPKPEVKAALDRINRESDTLIDCGAAFVAFTSAKNLVPTTRESVNQTVTAVYKSRHPEDATLAGLQKLLQEKAAALGLTPAAPGN
jgi:tetratricopeptide (TPR) repeat protein